MTKMRFLIIGLLCFVSMGNNSTASEPSVDKPVVKIMMVVWRGETEAENGFRKELQKLGYPVHIEVYNAKQDRGVLAGYLRTTFSPAIKNYDYIYSFGTTASQMIHAVAGGKVPHIFNIVTDPVKAGIVRDLSASGENVSGVSHAISLDMQLKIARRIKPFKRLGLLYNPREKNSLITLQQLKTLGEHYQFEVIEFRAVPGTDILYHQLENLISEAGIVDAVYLPLDSYMASNAQKIGESLRKARIFSIGAQHEYIKGGALMGLIPDYYHLGQQAALILDRHERGEAMGAIPVYTVKKPRLEINAKTLSALNMVIPADLLEKADLIE